MSDLVEDRVYDDRSGKQDVYVAAERGVAVVEVSERIGRFHLDRRCRARDLAAADGLVAVATDRDVLLCDATAGGGAERAGDDGTRADGAYVETGFGAAAAVGFDDGALVAADDDESEIRRLLDPREGPTEWLPVADVDAPVRAIDGPLLAAGDGVYRLTVDEIEHVGLTDARDVAAAGPLAATGDGLYRLGPGWTRDLDGTFGVAAARRPAGADATALAGEADASDDGANGPDDGDANATTGSDESGPAEGAGRAHAATADALFERAGGEWARREVPETPVADVAYGATAYAVTPDGAFLADRGDRWELRTLGLSDVAAVAVP